MRAEHGTAARYASPCRCDDCKAGHARETRERRRRRAYGQAAGTDIVSAQPAVILIRYFCETLGVSSERFAVVTGISVDTVKDLRAGARSRVTRRVSDAILGVDGAALLEAQSERRRPAAPYREYIMRLGAAGWSQRRLGRMTDADLSCARPGRKYISVRVARQLETLFTEIGDKLGPDRESARRLQARGWQPPAGYDASWRELVADAMYKDLDM